MPWMLMSQSTQHWTLNDTLGTLGGNDEFEAGTDCAGAQQKGNIDWCWACFPWSLFDCIHLCVEHVLISPIYRRHQFCEQKKREEIMPMDSIQIENSSQITANIETQTVSISLLACVVRLYSQFPHRPFPLFDWSHYAQWILAYSFACCQRREQRHHQDTTTTISNMKYAHSNKLLALTAL